MQGKAIVLDQRFQLERLIVLGDTATYNNLNLYQSEQTEKLCQLLE